MFYLNISVQKPEIEKLLSMYNMFAEQNPNKKLDRLKFRDILHDVFGMTDDMLMDRGEKISRALSFDKRQFKYLNILLLTKHYAVTAY